MLKRYMRVVEWVVSHRLITILAAITFFVISLALTPLLPKGFIPPDDNDQTQIYLELAPGSTLEQTTQLAEEARLLVKNNVPEVKTVYTAVGGGKAGGDAFMADTGGDPRKATLTLLMKSRGDRPKKQIVEDKIRQLMLQLPGVKVKVGLGGSGEKYNVMLLGEDPASLAAVGKAFEKDLRTVQGIGNVSSSSSLVRPEIVLEPKLDKAAELGISTAVIANTLRIATVGDYNSLLPRLNTSARQVPIVVKLDQDARTNLDYLAKVTIPSANGPILLSQVVDIKMGSGAAQIGRYDRVRNISYNIELSGKSIADLAGEVRELPSIKNKPAGVSLSEVGDAEVMTDLFNDFMLAIAAGILCIYLVLILLFKNVLQPITILMALPLSIGGAFIALLLTNSSLSMPSLIGLLMLMGVTTKNSILLVEYAIVAKNERGLSAREAMLDACHKRAMPILMTTIAMAAGMLPIALGWSPADQSFRSPMAWTVIGGLVTSTVLSLLVIPAVYLYMEDFGSFLARKVGLGKARPQLSV